jgi:hypothetical protein
MPYPNAELGWDWHNGRPRWLMQAGNWATHKVGARQARLGRLAGFRPNRPGKIESIFIFSNLFRIYELNMFRIQIQISNNFYSQKLKYKSTSSPKEKYASA